MDRDLSCCAHDPSYSDTKSGSDGGNRGGPGAVAEISGFRILDVQNLRLGEDGTDQGPEHIMVVKVEPESPDDSFSQGETGPAEAACLPGNALRTSNGIQVKEELNEDSLSADEKSTTMFRMFSWTKNVHTITERSLQQDQKSHCAMSKEDEQKCSLDQNLIYFIHKSESMSKKRKYSEDYLKIGFTTMLANNGVEKPQCLLCHVVLSAESMKPSKLKRHLQTKHPEHATKNLDFFKRHELLLKRQRLDAGESFQQQNAAAVEASYEVALEIAKQKKPHTIGETLIKPCMLKTVKLILGEASAKKMQQVSLSNNTIQRRISHMSMDVKEQVLDEIKASPLFSFQLDESTDVSSCSQLLVFVRYIHSYDIKEEFMFCSALETTTKADDVMEKVSSFFRTEGLHWGNVCGVCTDGAPVMLGSKSGFQTRVNKLAPQAKGIHCMIHRYALASKTLPTSLREVLDSVIKIVNYLKAGALNTHLFKELCKDMSADHEVLLFYTAIRWLSKGNVLNRVFEMKDEIRLFLEMQEKRELLVLFDDEKWIKRVAYLADIFDQLNKLNLKLQGRETHVLLFQDCLRAFISKLQNWRRKVNLGNIAMFEKLCGVMDESEDELDQFLKDEVTGHLESLEKELQQYFPLLTGEEALVRNPFSATLDVSSIPDEVQDEFLDLRNDSTARDLFHEKSITQFWCAMHPSYSKVSMLALRVLLPFASTYLCEAGFSTLVHIKTKSRNKLDVEDDMRLALTNTPPRIPRLAAEMQPQSSH